MGGIRGLVHVNQIPDFISLALGVIDFGCLPSGNFLQRNFMNPHSTTPKPLSTGILPPGDTARAEFPSATETALPGETVREPLTAGSEKAKRIELTNFADLESLATLERKFEFELNGREVSVRLRGLTSDESALIDKITDAIIPPNDPVTKEPNLRDTQYLERLESAFLRKKVAAFDVGLLSFKLPGETTAQKVAALTKLPPGIHNELYRRIMTLSQSPIQNGLFT